MDLAQIALEAAKQADVATNFVYTMGDPSKSSESLTSIRYVVRLGSCCTMLQPHLTNVVHIG